MDLREMRRLALNRNTPARTLEEIFEHNRREHQAHGILVALAMHPRTPSHLRESILPHLFWRDLVKVMETPQVPQRSRNACMPVLRKRMDRAQAGEWRSFAGICPPRLFNWVLKRKDPALFDAVLNNPKMTETRLMRLVHSTGMSPQFARAISGHEKWNRRRTIQKGLVFCRNGDLTTSLSALKYMPRQDLQEIVDTKTLHRLIRLTAEKLLRVKTDGSG